MATMVLCPQPKIQFFDDNGKPLSGGCLYTYDPGAPNTPKATYADSNGTFNPNPVVLDSAGRASIWIPPDNTGYYYMQLWSGPQGIAGSELIWSQDNVGPVKTEVTLEADIIDTTSIKDSAVTSDKIADASVTTPKIANLAVNTSKLATNAVTLPKLTKIASKRVLGNNEDATSDVEELTADEVLAMASTATTTAIGSMRFATVAEVLAGMGTGTGDEAKVALSPHNFSASKLLGANGYYTLPGGLTLQWGASTSSGDLTVNFPKAFDVDCYHVNVMQNTERLWNYGQETWVWNVSKTSFTYAISGNKGDAIGGRPVFWFAIGK